MNPQIRGLHHNAYRCSDSERTRRFYEDFLGLPLAGARRPGGGDAMDSAQARQALQRWQSGKRIPPQQQQRAARVERPARRARQTWPECWAW